MNKPLVSIITPTFNHSNYIVECINSVLAQTYENWEQIIIDDGSSDGTSDIIRNTINNDNRFILITQENQGIFKLAETYNKALSLANGKYIAILEGDDFWQNSKLQTQVEILEKKQNCVLTYGKANNLVHETQNIMKVSPHFNEAKINCYNNNPLGQYFDCIYDDFFAPLTYLIRKDSLLKIKGFKQILPFPAVDLSTFLELSFIGNFYFVNEIFGTWRITTSQTTKTLPIEIIEGSQKIISEYFAKLSLDQKKNLKLTKEHINQQYHKRLIITYSRNGRFLLIQKKYQEARKSYLKSISIFGLKEPLWKFRSCIGFIMSLFHADVETIAEIFGKGRINSKKKN